MARLTYLSVEDFKRVDEETIRLGISASLLMESAGQLMAYRILSSLGTCRSPLILVGPSHNGGDALVVARVLLREGLSPTIVLINPEGKKASALFLEKKSLLEKMLLTGKASTNYFSVTSLSPKIKKNISSSEVIIDGLFGSGLNRPLSGVFFELINLVNQNKSATKIALDIPSGLFSVPDGGLSFKAGLTLTVGTIKKEFLYTWAAPYLGETQVVKIDYPPSVFLKYAKTIEKMEIDFGGERSPSVYASSEKSYGNKFSGGRSLAIVGSRKYEGAAYLAIAAALKNGSAYLSALTPSRLNLKKVPQLIVLESVHPEYVTAADFEKYQSAFEQNTNILIGPGLDRQPSTKELVAKVLNLKGKKIIVDADGLWFVAELLAEGKKLGVKSQVVLTPHTGEFLTLAKSLKLCQTMEELQGNLLGILFAFQKKTGLFVLFKEAHSFYIGEQVTYFPYPNAFLAKAGSGDILSGTLLAALAEEKNFHQAILLGMKRFIEKGLSVKNQKGEREPITAMLK
jgi:NAD(P)H-hydrate epimerase